jgi:hypothetical protein
MKNSRTLRTFFDDCALTLRYVGGTAHFELWIPGEADPEPLATLPAAGGDVSWAPTARELLEHYDEEREEMAPVSYADDIRSIVEDFAALQGDPQLLLERYVGFDEDDDDDDEDDDENKPLVIAREYEQLDIVTHRDDPKAGFVGWRIHWDGDQNSAPSPDDAPEVYYLVETCSQQYSEECGAPTYGTQAWRIEQGKVTHNAWFAKNLLTSGWGSDPAKAVKAVKELADVYIVAGLDGAAAIPPVDPNSLRVVESNNACCYLVY